jgi:hypothetical protein
MYICLYIPGSSAGDPISNRETKFVFKDCHGTGVYVYVYIYTCVICMYVHNGSCAFVLHV